MKDCNFCYEKERFPTLKQENEQLKQQLKNEKQLNAEIKKRLVAVEYDSNDLLKKRYEENKQLAKRICELQSDLSKAKSMIGKMKCCENCKYHSFWGDELKCNYGMKEALQEDKLVECEDMNKWELAE